MRILKFIWIHVGVVFVSIGSIMVFGLGGSQDFLEDMKLRLETELQFRKGENAKR